MASSGPKKVASSGPFLSSSLPLLRHLASLRWFSSEYASRRSRSVLLGAGSSLLLAGSTTPASGSSRLERRLLLLPCHSLAAREGAAPVCGRLHARVAWGGRPRGLLVRCGAMADDLGLAGRAPVPLLGGLGRGSGGQPCSSSGVAAWWLGRFGSALPYDLAARRPGCPLAWQRPSQTHGDVLCLGVYPVRLLALGQRRWRSLCHVPS